MRLGIHFVNFTLPDCATLTLMDHWFQMEQRGPGGGAGVVDQSPPGRVEEAARVQGLESQQGRGQHLDTGTAERTTADC